MKKKSFFIAYNAALAVMVAIAYMYMFFRWSSGGLLSSAGLLTLRYFTVLSNLLEGAASIICIAYYVKGNIPRWLSTLKFASAVCVGLTFLTVMVFLGPVFGYPSMFMGANLAFHLIVPLAAMLEYEANRDYVVPSFKDSFIALIPMILYGIYYILNILINGAQGNDWYGFAAAGFPASYLVFAFIALATWVFALILRLIKKKLS